MRLQSIPRNGVTMESLYKFCSVTRQGFFQAKLRYERELLMMESISDQVKEYRKKKDRRAGSRSLYYNLDVKSQFGIGVNKFEILMSVYQETLLVLRTRIITTKSCSRSKEYSNLANGLIINDINQLVVGDLTYLNIGKYRYYLFCLTDVYSGYLVGYCLHQRMRATEAYKAFLMWLNLRGKIAIENCIHHTDGGTQYFSDLYLHAMIKMHLNISVASNCLENGFAEQRNGFIKAHLIPTLKITGGNKLQDEFKKVIYFYNHERKQEKLGWRSPVEYEEYISLLEKKSEKRLYDFN